MPCGSQGPRTLGRMHSGGRNEDRSTPFMSAGSMYNLNFEEMNTVAFVGSSSSSQQQSASLPTIELNPSVDVLYGRGKGIYQSEGNKRLKDLITSKLEAYKESNLNKDKIQITRDIVNTIKRKGGRFLMEEDGGPLSEVPDDKARIKVAQALRHRLRTTGNGRIRGRNSSRSFSLDRKRPPVTSSSMTAAAQRPATRARTAPQLRPPTEHPASARQFPVQTSSQGDLELAGQALFSLASSMYQGNMDKMKSSKTRSHLNHAQAEDDITNVSDFELFGDLERETQQQEVQDIIQRQRQQQQPTDSAQKLPIQSHSATSADVLGMDVTVHSQDMSEPGTKDQDNTERSEEFKDIPGWNMDLNSF